VPGWSSNNKPNQPITGINVTPLVDITLVLLIIFMVTAKLVVSRALPLDLPQAATSAEVQEVFSLNLLASGELEVDGTRLDSDAALLRLASSARQRNTELRAVVRADGSVPHERVMHALDVLRQAGVVHVAFAVAPGAPLSAPPAAPVP
jgi:biopolymer transport protein ExbD